MNRNLILGVLLGGACLFSACRPTYEVTQVKGGMVAMDSTWDAKPDADAVALIAPYKAKIDSVMYRVIGEADRFMSTGRPESLLSNLVADVLRESASVTLGHPADMGLVNMGGLRSTLSEGPVTVASAFEILPFENTLCVLILKGSVLMQLFENIAARGGEGVSGVNLVISADGKLVSAMINGKKVENEQDYTVATIDYLAEGNDGMTALIQAKQRICPEQSILRDLFIRYVEKKQAKGQKVSSRMEGRIVIR